MAIAMNEVNALSLYFLTAYLSTDYVYSHGRGPFSVTTFPDRLFEPRPDSWLMPWPWHYHALTGTVTPL